MESSTAKPQTAKWIFSAVAVLCLVCHVLRVQQLAFQNLFLHSCFEYLLMATPGVLLLAIMAWVKKRYLKIIFLVLGVIYFALMALGLTVYKHECYNLTDGTRAEIVWVKLPSGMKSPYTIYSYERFGPIFYKQVGHRLSNIDPNRGIDASVSIPNED